MEEVVSLDKHQNSRNVEVLLGSVIWLKVAEVDKLKNFLCFYGFEVKVDDYRSFG